MEHGRNSVQARSLNMANTLSHLDYQLRPPRPADRLRKRINKRRPTSGSASSRGRSVGTGAQEGSGEREAAATAATAATAGDGGVSRAATREFTPREMRGPRDAAANEVCASAKRDLFILQKRPTDLAKEAYLSGKRGLFT